MLASPALAIGRAASTSRRSFDRYPDQLLAPSGTSAMAKGPPALPFAHAHPAVIDEPPALHRPRGRLPAGGRLGLLGRRAQRPRAPRVALALVDADPLYVCARISRARVRHPATLRRPDRHTHSRPSTSHGASTRRSSRAARTSPPRPPTYTPPPGVPPPPTLGRRAAVGAAGVQ